MLLCLREIRLADKFVEGGIWGRPSTADLGNIAPRSCDERVGSADVKPKKRNFGSPQRGRKKKEFS